MFDRLTHTECCNFTVHEDFAKTIKILKYSHKDESTFFAFTANF